MEVSPAYGIVNLTLSVLWMLGLLGALTFALEKSTRTFGMLCLVLLILITYIHGFTLEYMNFRDLKFNVLGLILAALMTGVLTYQDYKKEIKGKIKLFGRGFYARFGRSVGIALGVAILWGLFV